MEGQMEEELWKQLPAEVQLKLLDDHLPVDNQCRLRSVSRAWKTPRLSRGALHGLYIRNEISIQRPRLFLYDRKIGKSHTLFPTGSVKLKYAGCVNGLFGAVFGTTTSYVLGNQVFYAVFNVFCPRWTLLPPPPPAPGRACLFAGLSKKPLKPGASPQEPPRIGMSKLEDYIFLAAMGNHVKAKVPATSLMLQVYSAGEWSCSLVELPPGHSFMYSNMGMQFRCGVLRGSRSYFLTIHSNDTAVSLCCVDVLAEQKLCKKVCGLNREFVSKWFFASLEHPKLAICSGKLLLVHRKELAGGEEHTIGVELLDEEKLQWRLISLLPLDLKAQSASSKNLYPDVITCGGDELVVYASDGTGYIYNLVTGAWSITKEILYPISYQ